MGVALRLDVIELLLESDPVFDELTPLVSEAVGVPDTELESEGVDDGVSDGVALAVGDGVGEGEAVREALVEGVLDNVGV